MFRTLLKLLRKTKKNLIHSQAPDNNAKTPINSSLEQNKQEMTQRFGHSPDLTIHSFNISLNDNKNVRSMLFCLDGMVDETRIDESILATLQKMPHDTVEELHWDHIRNRISHMGVKQTEDLEDAALEISQGSVLLLIEGYLEGLLISCESLQHRSIAEPTVETIVRGPHEGFVESIQTNMSLLRKYIRHPSLHFQTLFIGEYTRSPVTIAYMKDIAQPEIVSRVIKRLGAIDTDNVHYSGEIEQFIEDTPFTIFPTIGNTERPDKASAALMEGRIVILVHNDPVALIAPFPFISFLQATEDFGSRPYYVSFIRILRFISFILSICLPAIFIFSLNFHQEIIPSELIINFAAAREQVPFPLTMEVILMVLVFEVVREAGIRMPRAIGQAVSIVGTIILGEVSVSAGLVGAPTVIVVAFAAIATFAVTPLADVISLSRILLIVPTSIFGLYGFLFCFLGIVTHMVALRTMGEPYMAPFAPFHWRDWKDTLIRLPYRWLRFRPSSIPNQRPERIRSLPDPTKEE